MPSTMDHPVVLYGRVSQARDERSKSVDDQLAELRRWAKREGWRIVDEFRDDNISASRYAGGKYRDGWQRAMEHVQSGTIRALLVWEFSRSTRDLRVYTALEEACRVHRVSLGYSGRLHDLSTADGGFSAGLDALLAAKESAMTSERVQRAVESRATGGRPHGRLPYGYRRKIDPATGAVLGREIDPHTGPIVAEIVRRLLAGDSAVSIANDLNRRGVTTSSGARWRGTNLVALAKRPTYASLRVHRGDVLDDVTGTWPQIISTEDHHRLRALLGAPERARFRSDGRAKHLGVGLYRCGCSGCDGRMRRINARHGDGGAYDCRECHGVYRDQGDVDRLVEDYVVPLLMQPDLLEIVLAGPDGAAARQDAEAQVAVLRAEEADMQRALRARELSPADMVAWRKGWEPMVKAAEAVARPPAKAGPVLEMAGPEADQRWRKATLERRRAVLDALVTVTIHPTGRYPLATAGAGWDPLAAVNIEPRGY